MGAGGQPQAPPLVMAIKLLFVLFTAALAGVTGQSATGQGNYTLAGFGGLQDVQSFITPATIKALNVGLCGRYQLDASLCQTQLAVLQNSSVNVVATYNVSLRAFSSQMQRVLDDLGTLPAWAMTVLVSSWLQNTTFTVPSNFLAVLGPPVAIAPSTTSTTSTPRTPPTLPFAPSWTPVTTIQGSFVLTIVGLSASTSAANFATSSQGKIGVLKALAMQVDLYAVLADKFSLNVTMQTARLLQEQRKLQFGLSAYVTVTYVVGLPAWAPSSASPENIIPFLSPGYKNQGSLLVGINYQVSQSMGNAAPTITAVTAVTVPQVYVNGVPSTSQPSASTEVQTVSQVNGVAPAAGASTTPQVSANGAITSVETTVSSVLMTTRTASSTETTQTKTTTTVASPAVIGLVSSGPRIGAWVVVYGIAAILAVLTL